MSPSSADIRRLLTEAFSDEEVEALCFDHFPAVQDEFSAGMSKPDKIQRLLGYCRRLNLAPQLMAAIQTARPAQYDKLFGGMSADQLQSILSLPAPTPLSSMSLQANQAMLDRLILNQSRSVRYHLTFTVSLAAVGLGTIVAAPVTASRLAGFAPVVMLTGVLFFSLGALQFKDFLNRRDKAEMFQVIKVGLTTLVQSPEAADADAEARSSMEHLLWQAIQKTVG